MTADQPPYVPRQYSFTESMKPVYVSDSAAVLPQDLEYTLATQLTATQPAPQLVEYRVDPSCNLHVFRPAACARNKLAPAVLHFHGGGWSGGEPEVFYASCRYFAGRGAVAISVQYRKYEPEGTLTPQDCTADCRAAMAYVRSHATQLGVDASHIAVLGDSAGGHLALMMSFTPKSCSEAGLSDQLAGLVVSYNPVADLETDPHGWNNVHGQDRLTISPLHRLAELAQSATSLPPTLLVSTHPHDY